MKSCPNAQRGEAALLEAAVILPLVFLTLVSLLGISLWLCDAAAAESLAEKYAALAVQETRMPGAAAVILQREQDPSAVWNQNTVAFVEQERRDTSLFPSAPDYTALQAFLSAEAEKMTVMKWGRIQSSVKLEEGPFRREIRVTVTFAAASGSFFGKLFPECSAAAVLRVGDCPETVRTVDLIADVAEDVRKRMSGGTVGKESP